MAFSKISDLLTNGLSLSSRAEGSAKAKALVLVLVNMEEEKAALPTHQLKRLVGLKRDPVLVKKVGI